MVLLIGEGNERDRVHEVITLLTARRAIHYAIYEVNRR